MRRLFLTLFILALAAPSFAITGISIGIHGGKTTNYDQESFAIPGQDDADMTMVGGQIKISKLPMIDLLVSGDYAWKNETYSVAGQDLEVKRHDLAFSATALYPLKLKVIQPYIGGGISTHNLGFDYVKPLSLSLEDNNVVIPESDNRLGYHMVGGFEIALPAFPVGLNAEYRLNWIDTPVEVTKYNSITVGLSYKLP